MRNRQLVLEAHRSEQSRAEQEGPQVDRWTATEMGDRQEVAGGGGQGWGRGRGGSLMKRRADCGTDGHERMTKPQQARTPFGNRT